MLPQSLKYLLSAPLQKKNKTKLPTCEVLFKLMEFSLTDETGKLKKKKNIYIYTHTHIYICYSMLRTHSWYSEHTVETYGSSVLKYRKDSHKRREIREVVFYLLFILKYFYMPFSLIQVCELLHERNTMLISVTFIF